MRHGDARLYRKARASIAKLSFMKYTLMDAKGQRSVRLLVIEAAAGNS